MNLMQALLNQENVSLSQKQHSSENRNSQSSKFRIRSMLSEVDFPAAVILDLEVHFQKADISLRVMVKTVAIVPTGIVMELYGRGAHGKRE